MIILSVSYRPAVVGGSANGDESSLSSGLCYLPTLAAQLPPARPDEREFLFIMSRQLLPPRGIFVDTQVLFDLSISPALRDTLLQLKALAWGQDETPAISIHEIATLTGKSDRTIYGHLASLRDNGALRWRNSAAGTIIVYDFRPANHDGLQNSAEDDCKNLQMPVNINSSFSELINTASKDNVTLDCKNLQTSDGELQDFTIQTIERIFRQVTKLLVIPSGGREEVYSIIGALLTEYGEEETVKRLNTAWEYWNNQTRKDNGQRYSKLNHAWINYALLNESGQNQEPKKPNGDGSIYV